MEILVTSIVDVRSAANNRLHYFLEGLSERHDITVICPRDPERKRELPTGDFGSHTRLRGIDVTYLANRLLSPIVQEATAELLLSRSDLDFERYDVHLDYNSLMLGHATARRVRSAGTPTVYDLADDIVDMVRTSPQIPRYLRATGARLAEFVLDRNLANAHVTYTTESLRRRMGIAERTSTRIPNGVDIDAFTPAVPPKTADVPDAEFIVGYVGTTRDWVDLDRVVRSVASVRERDLDIGCLVVGDEGTIEDVKDLSSELGISGVCSFVPPVPYSEIPAYVTAMDVGTIPFRPGKVGEHSLPLKLFEYMACERPVISTPIRGVEEVAPDTVRFAPDQEAFETHLQTLAESPSLRRQLGREGRALVEEGYSWEVQVDTLERLLTELCDQRLEPPRS